MSVVFPSGRGMVLATRLGDGLVYMRSDREGVHLKSFEEILEGTATAKRDPQRYRVYAAEEEAMKLVGKQNLNPVTIQMMAHEIQHHPAIRKLYPKATEERFKIVIKGKSRTSAYYFMGAIYLPKWAHSDWVLCHELAHMIDRRANGVIEEGHGPEFCQIMLSLIEAVVSSKAADTLRACYEKHEVNVQ